MIKRIIGLLLTIALVLGLSLSSSAISVPDRERDCSLTLMMEWRGKELHGGELSIYRVGDIVHNGSTYEYRLVPKLRDSGLSLDELDDARLASKLATLAKQKLPAITTPIKHGEAKFTKLKAGLYVVTQSNRQATKGYEAIESFLISLPQWQNGAYVYDFKAEPKVDLERKDKPDKPPKDDPDDKPEKPNTPSTPNKPTTEKPKLPQTGQLNWPVPLLTVGGILLMLLGAFLRFGKRDEHEK